MPAPIRIHEIDTSKRREVKRFVMLPFNGIYADYPRWVPPILPDARLQLDRKKNAFYKYNDAAFFVAERDGVDVGRICVIDPQYTNDFKGTQDATFYLFECIDDQEVANALFAAAAAWANARGLGRFRGPLGFVALDGFGMLAKGFEHQPAVSIPYNPPYYITLTENWGFELEERVYSGYVDVPHLLENPPEKILRVAGKVRDRYGFTTKKFSSKRDLRKFAAPKLAELYNQTLTHIAGDPPIPADVVDMIADSALMIADPELIKFIMKDDQIIGFLFTFFNINKAIQRARGRLLPFGLFYILREMKTTEWADFNGMGILPEYQGKGGTAIMYEELYYNLRDHGQFKHGEAIQISEFNAQSLNEMKNFGVDFYKTHHIYRKAL